MLRRVELHHRTVPWYLWVMRTPFALPPSLRKGARHAAARRFKPTDILEVRLFEEAKSLREQAKLLRSGAERDAALRKTRQAEIGARIIEWLRTPGWQPPK